MSRHRYSEQEQAFYRAYLNSPAWRAKKTLRIARAGGRCEWETTVDVASDARVRCPRTRYLCVHHNTYERLGAERDSDLDVYCWFHHMLEHLLWKKCGMCAQPCLQNEIVGTVWLDVVLKSMGIYLDSGPVVWKNLPIKEVLLAQVESHCPDCAHYLKKD